MDATATEPFGTLLRAARLAAGWTQEALAERAGVSVRNIQSLEAGLNRPQRDTAQRLATALGLDEAARTQFLAAAAPAPRRRSGLPESITTPAEYDAQRAPSIEPLPTGTVTFLFTDVEESTRLWEQHPQAMREALAHHDALIEQAVADHSGVVVRPRGEGDSRFAVFARASDAVAAALCVQRTLHTEVWPPETPLRVRLALHTGSAQLRAGDYYGPVVNRCARIRSLAHGGQVLLSTTTAALVRDELPAGASLRSLGAHPLRGLAAPEEIYQLCHPDLPGEFPPLLSPAAPRHNLPLALTELIGREAEQGEVLALLAQARLVTLTGSGGVGKTRLSLAVAAELVDQYPDGVWLVELASLAEERLVAQSVLEAVGTREEPGRQLLATLTDHLKEKRLLLVLDNCEHLVGACATLVEAVLRRCPSVRVLATSREGLEVAGEHRYRVPSLSIPDLAHLPPPERLFEAMAVALFVARARERRPDFALTAQNVRAVAQVCTRLDGIPLAIELAAARMDSLGVEGIAARLDDRFHLLTGGPRSALPRQRTLRAALDWSYALLSDAERLLLDRLSVFAGGWTLDAAEAVCAGEGVEAWEILDLLDSLVRKSLLQVEEADRELRYGLLETVRQHGQERLAAAGVVEVMRERHLGWYLALAEEAAPHLEGTEHVAWLDRLEAEHDNLRAALRGAQERGAAEQGLRLAGALGPFWDARSYFSEGRGWLEGALATGTGGSDAARARALTMAGYLARWQGDVADAVVHYEESLALYRALGDTRGIAVSLHHLGITARQGDFARAMPLLEESLALYRGLGDQVGTAAALNELAFAAYLLGAYKRAAAHFEESLAQNRAIGRTAGIAYVLSRLACALEGQGAYARAVAMQEEALAHYREAGNRMGITFSLMNLGWALLALGEDERATALLEESLARSREEGHFWGVPYSLTYLGWAAYRRGEYERATALQEDALARYRQLGIRRGIAWVLTALGCVVQAQGAYALAATYLREGLQISQAIGTMGVLAEALEGAAWLAEATGQTALAARLVGAAEALREDLGAALHPVLRPGHERAVEALRDGLGEAAFATAWAAGRTLPLEEAVALALESGAKG
jgi:predicted ATPase/class 3 adenylate cyclase